MSPPAPPVEAGTLPGTLPRVIAPMVLAPPEFPPQPHPSSSTLLPPDSYWGVHPFLLPPSRSPLDEMHQDTESMEQGSGLTQWYATSNSSFTDLRKIPPQDRNAPGDWPTLQGNHGDEDDKSSSMMSPVSPSDVRKLKVF